MELHEGKLFKKQSIIYPSVLIIFHLNFVWMLLTESEKGNEGNVTSYKGSDWIRLVFAHPFPLNNGAPIVSANFISDGKVMATYRVAYGVRFT